MPGRVWLITGALLVVITGIGLIVLARNWPFTQQAVTTALEDRFARTVQIRSFRKTYLPPGCVAEGISFLIVSGYDSDGAAALCGIKEVGGITIGRSWTRLGSQICVRAQWQAGA
jgi:hypothetical protein